jgi:hypothetical protein
LDFSTSISSATFAGKQSREGSLGSLQQQQQQPALISSTNAHNLLGQWNIPPDRRKLMPPLLRTLMRLFIGFRGDSELAQ